MEIKVASMETIHPILSLVYKFEVPVCHQLALV